MSILKKGHHLAHCCACFRTGMLPLMELTRWYGKNMLNHCSSEILLSWWFFGPYKGLYCQLDYRDDDSSPIMSNLS